MRGKLFILTIYIMVINSFANATEVEKAFTTIYAEGVWGKGEDGYGVSGEGSTPTYTKLYQVFLQDFLDNKNIKSVVDVGCGDWQFSHLINWEGIDYKGIDIVKPVIERNKARYASKNVNFYYGDCISDLPSADLVICKEVLQHLPNDQIALFLKQINQYEHCLITNDVEYPSFTSNNVDIVPGGYRPLDITKPPFNVKGEKILIYLSGVAYKAVIYIHNPR